jgi:hypothetical protein
VQSLRYALPELAAGFVAPRGRPVLIAPRQPCRRCTARRGISAPVTCWLPTEFNLCPSHRIWLGAATRGSTDAEQHDLAELPQLLHAQHRHTRLARRYGRRTSAEAFTEAARVTFSWARRGHYVKHRQQLLQTLRGHQPTNGRLPRDDPFIPLVTYPETVALTAVLAQPQWRHPPARYKDLVESAAAIYRFSKEVRSQLGTRFLTPDSRPDPLLAWYYNRRRLAYEAPDQAPHRAPDR